MTDKNGQFRSIFGPLAGCGPVPRTGLTIYPTANDGQLQSVFGTLTGCGEAARPKILAAYNISTVTFSSSMNSGPK